MLVALSFFALLCAHTRVLVATEMFAVACVVVVVAGAGAGGAVWVGGDGWVGEVRKRARPKRVRGMLSNQKRGIKRNNCS